MSSLRHVRKSIAGAVVAASLTLVSFASAAPVRSAEAPKPAQIDRNGVLILVRNALLALNAANETGNYTVLRDMGSPGFRDGNTAARLAEIFASQRAQKLDLSGVAVLDPQLTLLPQIEPSGMMHLAGFFPSVPLQINFEMLFAPVDGRWRIFGLAVNVGSSAPVAPGPAQTSAVDAGKKAPAKANPPKPTARTEPAPKSEVTKSPSASSPAEQPQP